MQPAIRLQNDQHTSVMKSIILRRFPIWRLLDVTSVELAKCRGSSCRYHRMTKKSHFRSLRRSTKSQLDASPSGSSEPASAFNRGLVLHQTGRLSEAEEMYRQVLKAQPNHWDSLHFLGVIHHQRGDYREAVRQIDAAIRVRRRQPKLARSAGASPAQVRP